MKSPIIALLLFFLIHKLCLAQSINITFLDFHKKQTFKIQSIGCNDTVAIEKALTSCLLRFYSKGYIAATIDSFRCSSNLINAYGILGSKYRWVKVLPDSLSNSFLNVNGLSLPRINGKTLSPATLSKYIKSALSQFEDNGYPFAKISLANINIKDNGVSANISIHKGNSISIDTIYLKGDARLNQKKLAAIINLKKGDPYSEAKIKRIDQRLNQQPYINIIKSSEIEFLTHKARVYCYLGNKPASRFWGMAGFYKDKDEKFKLHGDVNLTLFNSLKSGEKLSLAWTAPGKGTQNLNIGFDWPYILGWQIGTIGSFALYKRDSSYITFNPKFSIVFFVGNGGRFFINTDYKKTSYNSRETLVQTQFGNTTAFLYGLGYEYNNYNKNLLPIRGLLIRSNINTGKRDLTSKQGSSTNLIECDLLLESHKPIIENRLIIAARINSRLKTLYSTSSNGTLFENEMYHIGGLGTIRGFNQEMILSQAYSVSSLELHFRVSEGSGVYLFTDKAFVKTYEFGSRKDAWPLGLGLGINLATKAGQFNLSYALGQGFGQSIGTRDAKVHFGILAVF